ncbi:MAG: hypothetical protein ABWY78_06275 [Microvirga sp.]
MQKKLLFGGRYGFTLPGNASAAAKRGHKLGLIRQWTPDEAREYGRRAAAKRQQPREMVAGGR